LRLTRAFHLFIVVNVLLASTAHATFKVVPYLGYTLISGMKYSISETVTVVEGEEESETTYAEWSYKALLLGARGSFEVSGVQVGLDYSRNTIEPSGGGGGPINFNGSYTGNFLGMYLGYTFPFDIYGHYTYFLSSRYTSTEEATEGNSLRGDGFAFHASYPVYANIHIGLEYRRHKMDVYVDEINESTTITSSKYKSTELLIVVSFPIGL
jgi:hypothetical protein